ncbi:helix-turn-helix transcriptional regulator [Mycoplana ramosa]|uniref:LuxR C-terminal-related transcriptional regulator n=1 Tax=Mycoplana ramosa TaxID=40837 RepID=A0ABW3YZW8_MYCRA
MVIDEGTAAAVFGQFAATLGTPRFHRGVLDIIRKIFPSDFAQVYQLGRDGRAVCIDPCDSPEDTCRSYEQLFSPNCPLSRYWQKTGRPGVIAMKEVLCASSNYGTYFSDFYAPLGLVDEIGVLLPSPGRRTVALFMERTRNFNEQTVKEVRKLYSGITLLHRANNQLILRNAVLRKAPPRLQPNSVAILDRTGETVFANREWRLACQSDRLLESSVRTSIDLENASIETDGGTLFISRLDSSFAISPGGRLCVLEQRSPAIRALDAYKRSFLKGIVSKREHEIICAIIDGYPTRTVAERLGCALETVKVHKKRIYNKLDITTEREIFLLFLEHLQRCSFGAAQIH